VGLTIPTFKCRKTMDNPNYGEKMNTSLNISAAWTRFLKRVLLLSIRVLTKVLDKMKEPEWWKVSQEMEADELSLIPPHEYPHINRKKVTIECETRNAFLLSVPVIVESMVEISKGDLLEFGIGLVEDSKSASRDGVSFSIFFEDTRKNLVFSKKLYPQFQEDRSWVDAKIDLSDYSGKEGNLIVETNNNSQHKIAWSNPVVYRTREKGSTVILISLDALRPDHLHCYGYCRETSPYIDALARESVLFENAISQSHWTLPAHMSLMTSLYPSTHKVYRERELEKSKITLPQLLRKNGSTCFGFATHTRLRPEYGFARGFDSYMYKEYDFHAKRATADKVTSRAMNFVTEHKDKDTFIFLHYFDIHTPYMPPGRYATLFDTTYAGDITGRDFRSFTKPIHNIFADPHNEISERDLAHMVALYDGEVAHIDYYVGMLVAHLKSEGLYENAVIIVTSDHGEELWEHKSIGHNTLYDEVIRVPLIIKLPEKRDHTRMRDVVQSIDIFPTVLDVLGIVPPRIQGSSLLPLIENAEEWRSEAYSERLSGWNSNEYGIAVRTGQYKYIYTTRFDTHDFTSFQKHDEMKELYRIDSDPRETRNIIHTEEEVAERFQEKVDAFIFHTLKTYKLNEEEKIDKRIKELRMLKKL
jgi:arylsulfatase A-like enzyme